jgi:succinate-semialdehyde dehydrogenase
MVVDIVARSRIAQEKFEKTATQEQVDAIIKDFSKIVYDNAEMFARLAVSETDMGVYEDKVKKKKGKARIIWNDLKGKKSVGVISRDDKTGITRVARPLGVVAAITPCTNPVVTPMCNAMFAIKGRNSIIIAPHPRAKNCGKVLVDMYRKVLEKHNAPKDLVITIENPSTAISQVLMASCDVTIATGGMGMVKAAYSSGKPAYGVGVGNVQCIIDRDYDYLVAVPKIIEGRKFDNGIICSGEQSIIIPEEMLGEIINEFKNNGCYYTDDEEEVDIFTDIIFPNGVMNKHLVGKNAYEVARRVGIEIDPETKVILLKPKFLGSQSLLSKEKMCPVISVYTYKTWEEALSIAKANLDVEGKGHSVVIHSENRSNIEEAANKLAVCRVLVNQICSTMNGGSFFNSLTPTTTLGCGSWGNNSISENLGYEHLLNITKVSFPIPGKEPTETELWGD